MSERGGDVTESPSLCLILIPRILRDSLRIFPRNKRTFLTIFAIAALPLSTLAFAASLSVHRLRARVDRLESLALLTPTRFEARQVWKESREEAASVLYARILFAIPSLALSLIVAVSAVTSAVDSHRGGTPTLRSAVNAIKQTWKRPLVTSLLVYAILLAFSHAPGIVAAMFPEPVPRVLILTVGSALQVYLTAVMSLAIVVSIAEDRFGVSAIRVGSELMEGVRVTGWVLSGLLAAASGIIARQMERTMDGRDLLEEPGGSSTVAMVAAGIAGKFWVVVLYGFVVVWSFVVFGVFYCECSSRKRVQIRGETEMTTVAV